MHRGFPLSAFGAMSPNVAKALITKRLRQFERATAYVAVREGAVLLTRREDFVLGRSDRPGRIAIKCAKPEHPAWMIKPSLLLWRRSWCVRCAHKVRKPMDEVRAEIESRGGTLMSRGYRNANEKLRIRCASGHAFRMTLSKITNCHQWCPKCRSTVEESAARHFLEYFLGFIFDEVHAHPEWLAEETGLPLELDGLSEKMRTAFEYQGEHHFRQISWFGHRLFEVQRRDALKVQAAERRGYRLIVVPTFPETWTQESACRHVLDALRGYVSAAEFAEMSAREASAPRFVRPPDGRLEDLRRVVEAQGATLVEESYLGFHVPHLVRCGCGTLRRASPANIKAGKRCVNCGRQVVLAAYRAWARKRFDMTRPAKLESLRVRLAAMNCTLRATNYEGRNKQHAAVCGACGHEWGARWSDVREGRGCPACGTRRKLAAFAAQVQKQTVLTDARRARARQLHAAGHSDVEIAHELCVTRQKVRQYLFSRAA